MNFNINKYKTNYSNLSRNHKLDALETVLRFLNSQINIKQQGYFSNNIIEGNLDNLTFEQKELLLVHLEYCHEKINKNFQIECDKNYSDLLDRTVWLFKKLKYGENIEIIKNIAKQFLFLISHRDKKYHNNYAKTADNFRLFLSNNLSYTNILDNWVSKNRNSPNYASYIEANNRIISCLNNLDIKLDLSNLGLSSIPKDIFSELKHIKILKLNKNYIEILDNEFNKLINLEELDLSYNNIRYLEYENFQKLINLRRLNLNNNVISEINSDSIIVNNSLSEVFIFNDLKKLSILDLRNNKITEIKSGTFNNLTNLTEIKLLGNQIKSIPKDAFDENIRARILNNYLDNNIYSIYFAFIDINSLQNILNNWVEQNGNLDNYLEAKRRIINSIRILSQSLDLSGLNLTSVPICLSSLTYIQLIDLSKNQIREINFEIFNNLINLIWIDLSENQIREINPEIFNNLTELGWLNLSKNQIREIDYAMFNKLASLKWINLSKNHLTKVNSKMFNKLIKIDLSSQFQHEYDLLESIIINNKRLIDELPDLRVNNYIIHNSIDELKIYFNDVYINNNNNDRQPPWIEKNINLSEYVINFKTKFDYFVINRNLETYNIHYNPITADDIYELTGYFLYYNPEIFQRLKESRFYDPIIIDGIINLIDLDEGVKISNINALYTNFLQLVSD